MFCKKKNNNNVFGYTYKKYNILYVYNILPSNTTKEEREALQTRKKDSNVMILPADNGRATVILNTADYKTKCQDLLNDERTYKQLKKDPTNIYRMKLINVLKEMKNSGAITQEQYYKVYPTATEPPKFYGLPKVHKPPCPLRPTVACRGSIMYGTARWVADILAPMVGKTPHHLQNSADLVNKLSHIRVVEDESIISFDVSALFTSVPVEESLR